MKASKLFSAVATAVLCLAQGTVSAQTQDIQRKEAEFVNDYMTPTRIIKVEGNINDPEALLQPFNGQVSTSERRVSMFKSEKGVKASILLDFGKEIHGGLQIVTAISDKTTPHVRICLGESVSEALSSTEEAGTTATNEHSLRDFEVTLPWLGAFEIGNSGFRFARIDLLTEDFNLPIRSIRAIARYRDIPYLGSFKCSDDRLNQIWQTGAYTVHLNMQDYVWDGIKRDRLVWIGDMHPEVMTIGTVFGDHSVVKKSLDYARDNTPATGWMNGICSYSLWWIIIQHHLYYNFGDLEYLKEQQSYLADLLRNVIKNMDGSKENYKDGRFIDWPSADLPDVIHAGLQAISVRALEAGAEMAQWLGDAALQKECTDAAQELRKYVPDHVGNKQAAALLSIENMLDAQEAGQIIAKDDAKDFSSFMGYYMLEGLAKAGLYDEAFKCISDYWGTMLDLGATTFWEDFSYDKAANAGRIDEIVPEGKYDIHADGGRYCYVGLRHSFCHGWASGPTAFLSEHVLGVTPAEVGFKKIKVQPQLGSLEWAEGTVPTPKGVITVSHKKAADGSVKSVVTVPKGIKVVDKAKGMKVKKAKKVKSTCCKESCNK